MLVAVELGCKTFFEATDNDNQLVIWFWSCNKLKLYFPGHLAVRWLAGLTKYNSKPNSWLKLRQGLILPVHCKRIQLKSA